MFYWSNVEPEHCSPAITSTGFDSGSLVYVDTTFDDLDRDIDRRGSDWEDDTGPFP